MNIMQTLHPVDKDYGHMKIDEPKTPYSYMENEDGADSDTEIPREPDPDNLAELISQNAKVAEISKFSFDEDDEMDVDEWNELTEEEKERRRDFQNKRKKHYNEFQMVQMARKLLEAELKEDENDDDSAKDTNPDSGGQCSSSS